MRFKRIAAGVAALLMGLTINTTPAMAAGTAKNETVYAALNNDGSVRQIYVVNQLIGQYTDYGNYSEIKNLSTSSVPTVDGDEITFPDQDVEGGLYYQGTMTGELPMSFDIAYTLDGQSVDAADLSGASGHLTVSVGCSANPLCDEAVREGLMTQISLSLDTEVASSITAPDATVVTVGRTANISYIILPGEEGTLTVDADISDFSMDPISITLLKGTLSLAGFGDTIDQFENGFDDMISGADDMVSGTTDLKDGMYSLLDGVGDLKNGLGKLKSGGSDLYDGMKEYGDNLDAYLSGVKGLVQPSADIQEGLNGLSENGAALAQGVSDISDNLSALSASGADLKTLAESLAASTDPNVAALANGMLQTLGAVDGFAAGLDSASGSLDEYMTGVQQTATGYGSFQSGVQSIADGGGQLGSAYGDILDGAADYKSGVSSSASGAKTLYNSIKGLPDDVQALIDGQLEFKDGIVSAKEDIKKQTSAFTADDVTPVSFASPEKNHPNSVQYILTTPAIEKKKEAPAEEETKEDDNFLTRLAALFQ